MALNLSATIELPKDVVLNHLWWSGDTFGPIATLLQGSDSDYEIEEIGLKDWEDPNSLVQITIKPKVAEV